MCTAIETNKLLELPLTTNNRGILDVFTGQKVTTEQANDMLNCQQIGNETYLKYYILKQPSTAHAPVLTQENTNNEDRQTQEDKIKPRFETNVTMHA